MNGTKIHKVIRTAAATCLLLALLSASGLTLSKPDSDWKSRYGILKLRAAASRLLQGVHIDRIENALPIPPGSDFVFNPSIEDPIEVVPGGMRFSSLKAALDHCASGRPESSGIRDTTVVINANTTIYGNFTLPTSGVRLVGLGGPFSVALIGNVGVTQPTLRYAPTGGVNKSHAWLEGLWIVGEHVAALEYAGTDAWAQLWIRNCRFETTAQIPAILATGSGFGSGQVMSLSLDYSGIESEGTGVLFDVGQHVDTIFLDTYVSATTAGVDIMASTQTGTAFRFLDSGVWGEYGIRAYGPGFIWLGESYGDGNLQALVLDNIADAVVERGELHSENGNTMEVSGSELGLQYCRVNTNGTGCVALSLSNGSDGNIAFCDFGSDLISNAIVVDGTSTRKAIYNHWNFDPLP